MPTPVLESFLDALSPDAPQVAPGITVIPLLSGQKPELVYQAMSRAMAAGTVEVSEVNLGGAVPDLVVRNAGTTAVLFLDGEEVAGAKQNRILNTSILIDAQTGLKVPVSCTEQGRWHYTSDRFKDSGHIAPRSVRSPKSQSVHQSLRAGKVHRADQGEVWDSVAAFQMRAAVDSPTGALRDAMERRRTDFDEVMRPLRLVEGQIGMVVVTADGFVGMDAVLRSDVFADLHDRLVRSYVADVVAGAVSDKVRLNGRVDRFLASLRAGSGERFDSPGLGTDVRISGKAVAGSVLEHADEVVHMTAFRVDEDGAAPRGRIHRSAWRRS